MRIRRQKQGLIVRITVVMLVSVVALGSVIYSLNPASAASLNKNYNYIKSNYSVPSNNVAWVAPSGSDDRGNGSEGSPYATFAKALSTIKDGGTVVAKSGIYREPHFFITKKNITLQAAPQAEVWLKGSDVVSNWTREGSLWKTTGNYQNFCRVCTTNADPKVEGMAAYIEQVFINDKALTQVASKSEVKEGTFYVEDHTQTTRNGGSFSVAPQDTVTYYVGSNPMAGTTEISQRARAFTAAGSGFTLKGINISQYAPHQVWGFNDPVMGDKSGPVAVSINGDHSLVQDVIIAQSATLGLFLDGASNAVVKNSQFLDNGSNGAGANRSHNATFENNTFSNNNFYGFETNGSVCTAYCGIADIKVTHTENFTFRGNVVDNSKKSTVNSDIAVAKRNQLPGFWCDEGCIGAKIVNNYFTNAQNAIFYEVSDSGIIASNIIESSGTGIYISGSSNVKIYNNTISRTAYPMRIREDDRVDGCNRYDANTHTCVYAERWSQSKKLSWDTTGLAIYNNIISSRASIANDESGPYWAYQIRTEGGTNQNGRQIYTNQMLAGIDYNAYYRNDTNVERHLLTWHVDGQKDPIGIRFSKTSDVASDSRVSKRIDGLERNTLDLNGSRQANPYFVKEATNNTEYNSSNYNLRADSPAVGSGKALPSGVAQAIDPTGKTVQAGGKVNRGALVNVRFATNNQQSAVSTKQTTEGTVTIPDTNLKKALNKTLADILGKQRNVDQDITVAEMKKITGLNLNLPGNAANEAKITDLTGLEAATNLDWLSLDGNNITDLTPVAKLKKLTSITAYHNRISSLEPLAELTKLKVVRVSGNPIASTKPFAKLTQLRYITMSGRESFTFDVADFVASAKNLRMLSIYDYGRQTTLANGASLSKFTQLEKLRLTGVKLIHNDVAQIGTLTQLVTLDLSYSTVTNLTPLKNLTNLKSLYINSQTAKLIMDYTKTSTTSPLRDNQNAGVPLSGRYLATGNNSQTIKLTKRLGVGAETPATWSKIITIGHAHAEYSGTLTIVFSEGRGQ